MSSFLSRLVAKSLPVGQAIRPRPLSIFESHHVAPSGEGSSVRSRHDGKEVDSSIETGTRDRHGQRIDARRSPSNEQFLGHHIDASSGSMRRIREGTQQPQPLQASDITVRTVMNRPGNHSGRATEDPGPLSAADRPVQDAQQGGLGPHQPDERALGRDVQAQHVHASLVSDIRSTTVRLNKRLLEPAGIERDVQRPREQLSLSPVKRSIIEPTTAPIAYRGGHESPGQPHRLSDGSAMPSLADQSIPMMKTVPTIRVHIGRIDVRAVMPTAAVPRRPSQQQPALPLNEYLTQRGNRQR